MHSYEDPRRVDARGDQLGTSSMSSSLTRVERIQRRPGSDQHTATKRTATQSTVCVVIPVVPSSSTQSCCEAVTSAFEETLVSVLENRPEGCEIIVVLGCEYSDPWNIREEVSFLVAPRGSSTTACINLGISSTRASIVHVIRPGWRATAGWIEAAVRRFDSEDVGTVVPLSVCDDDVSRVLSCGIRVAPGGRRIECKPRSNRRQPTEIAAICVEGPSLAAGFWRTELFDLDGPGFPTACGDGLADADMAVTAAAAGWTCAVEPTCLVIAPKHLPKRSGSFLAGLHAERLFWRSRGGRSLLMPLAAHVLEIARHAIAVAPWGTAAALFGRLIAIAQFGSFGPRFRRLRDIRAAVSKTGRGSEDSSIDTARQAIFRIDGPHGSSGKPHVLPSKERYRKSA